jgi:hypothetical protein
MNCPKCDADVSETYEPDDPSVGICGGWYCDACDLGIGEHEYRGDPMEGDVGVPPVLRDRAIGIPLSELSGQPGPKDDTGHPDHARYANFCRIARSWGYD